MGEDLYTEVTCKQCGQKKLAVASFCPHCGHVVKESWFEKITNRARSGGGEGETKVQSVKVVPILLSLLIAGYFFYIAIEKESIQGLIIALLSLFFAFRSLVSRSSQPSTTRSEEKTAIQGGHDVLDDELDEKFFCENCGTRVPGDATECPKCGMKFGN